MKQANKMLCMLLVMLLAFSTVSIGVNAAYTSYANPVGQTLHEKPLYTTAQRGSQLLDYIDEMLKELDFNEDYVVIQMNFTSVDATLDTVASLKSAAGVVGGDVKNLDFDSVPTTRRGTSGKTDLNILYETLYFLRQNRGIVGNFIRGELDLGIIGSFVDLDFNIHNMIVDKLYQTLVDVSYDPDVAAINYNTWTVDKILAYAMEVAFAGGTGADGVAVDGAMPSLSGKINLNTQTVWQIIELVVNAATKDIFVPFVKNDLDDLFDEYKSVNPSASWELIDLSAINLDSYVWGQYDTVNGVAGEINHFLYTVINQIWKGESFWVDGDNDMLEQNISEAIRVLYRELGDVILPSSADFIAQEEMDAMDFQERVSYITIQFLNEKMPYLIWDTATAGIEIPTDNMASVVCTVVYSILADLPVNSAYHIEDFEYGNIEWNKETALYMVADICAYYLNGAIPIDIRYVYGEGIEGLLHKLVNWALADNNFGGFFIGCGISASDSPWTKIDKTVLAVLPLHKILGGGATGSYDLVMNKIIDNALNLNIEGLLSLLYKDSNSLLNKPAPQFAVDILNRVLNVVVARNTQTAIFNPTPTSIDSLVQNANLGASAEKFLLGLYAAGQYEYFWSSLLPILNPLLIDESGYACNQKSPAAGYVPTTSLESLQAYVESVEETMREPDDVYNMDASEWNLSVDYELWRYNQLKDAIEDAWDVINGYDLAVELVAEATRKLTVANATGNAEKIAEAEGVLADAQEELASYNADKYNQAGKNLSYYVNKVLNDQVIANQGDLQYLVWVIEYNDEKYEQFVEENYPEDIWTNYQQALDHAYTILDMSAEVGTGANPDLKQSMVNSARRNLISAMNVLDSYGPESSSCNHTNAEIIPAVEATCKKTGLTEGKRCKDCGAIVEIQLTTPKTTHIADTPVEEGRVEPTSTLDGYYYSVTYCKYCGTKMNSEKVVIPATGIPEVSHIAGEPVRENIIESTCTSAGSYDEVVYCTCCSPAVELSRTTKTVAIPAHKAGTPVKENEVAATPTKDGSYDSVVYCTVCAAEMSRETIVIPATGHTAGTAVVENEKPAKCTTKGSYDEVIYCTCCTPKVELSRTTKTTNALGHKEVDVPAVAATCTATGLTEGKKCSVCGTVTVAQTTIPAPGHKPGEAQEENRVEATFETEGSYDMVVRCTVCNVVLESETVVIPAGKDGPADYEALDALVDEAEALDRSIYKNESLDALDAVLDKITYDMKAGQQSIVDGWAEELRAALDAMEIDDTKADAKVTTVISKNKVKAGDIVTVTVNLTTNFYVTNLQIPVLFDQTQFEVVGTKTNKNYLTISEMFTSRNYNLGGRADKQMGFDRTSNADRWNTTDAKAQYGVAYMTAAYDAGLGKDDTTYAKAQDDVFATFQLKALKDVDDTSDSVFVSTDWAKTSDNKAGMLVVGMTQIEDHDATVAGIDYTKVTYEAETIAIAGVTVLGTVKNYNDGIDNSDDVTITLTATDSDAVYTTIATGSGVPAFELTDVKSGTYTVTVSKASHATRVYTVVIGDEDVALDLAISLVGDITGDGKVNAIDVARVNAHAKGVNALSDYSLLCADINGDGKVNAIDVALVNAHSKGVKSLW